METIKQSNLRDLQEIKKRTDMQVAIEELKKLSEKIAKDLYNFVPLAIDNEDLEAIDRCNFLLKRLVNVQRND